jgi:hypothetical protein
VHSCSFRPARAAPFYVQAMKFFRGFFCNALQPDNSEAERIGHMRRILTATGLLALFDALAFAESWSGTSTTAFAMNVSGKVSTLDNAGNTGHCGVEEPSRPVHRSGWKEFPDHCEGYWYQRRVSGLRGRSLVRCSHQPSLTRSDPAKGAQAPVRKSLDLSNRGSPPHLRNDASRPPKLQLSS